MPNYILCNQFHERISVLVHTCTVSNNVKGNHGLKVNGTQVLYFVLNRLGLFRTQSYVGYRAGQELGKVSYIWHES